MKVFGAWGERVARKLNAKLGTFEPQPVPVSPAAPTESPPKAIQDTMSAGSGAIRLEAAKTTVLPPLDIDALLASAPTTGNAVPPPAPAKSRSSVNIPRVALDSRENDAPVRVAEVAARSVAGNKGNSPGVKKLSINPSIRKPAPGKAPSSTTRSNLAAGKNPIVSATAPQAAVATSTGAANTFLFADDPAQQRADFLAAVAQRKPELLAMATQAVEQLGSPPGDPAADKGFTALLDLFFKRPEVFKNIVPRMLADLHVPGVGDLGHVSRRVAMFRTLAEQLARPERVTQGAGTYTCVVSVAQVSMIQANPSGYYDMVRDLLIRGQYDAGHRLPVPIAADYTALDRQRRGLEGQGRSELDALIQSSLFNYARATTQPDGSPTGDAGFTSLGQSNSRSRPAGNRPSASSPSPGGRGSAGSGRTVYGGDQASPGQDPQGLTIGQIFALVNRVAMGGNWQPISFLDRPAGVSEEQWNEKINQDWETVYDQITGFRAQQARATFEGDLPDSYFKDTTSWGVPVGIYTEAGTFHEVLIQEIERPLPGQPGKVRYYDPATRQVQEADEVQFRNSVVHILMPNSTWGGQQILAHRERASDSAFRTSLRDER